MDYSALVNFLPAKYAIIATSIIGLCSAISTLVPDSNPIGKVLHFIAFNFGHAKNASADK